MIALDDIISGELAPPPAIVKIDVEGAEVLVLEGMREVLVHHRPIIFLATHGWQVRTRCFAILEETGYEVRNLEESQGGHEFVAMKPSR